MESKLPEHCPGPPTTQTRGTSETTDINLGKQLRDKEEELQQLRNEVQSYAGKLKGYQTLGQLYAESQNECSAYKQQNDELVRQLSSVMRRISPTQRNANVDTQPALENESESAGKGGDDAEKPRKSSCSLDLTEEGGRGRETEMSASSPSFVNIDSSSTDVSAASVPVTRAQDERREGDAAAVDADSASLSVDIEYLTAELRDAGQQQQQHDTATASYQHLSSNLIRTSLSVLKLEKQTRLQKAMMDQMTMKLTELNNQLTLKDQKVAQLQEDRARLAADMKSLKAAHDKQWLDAGTKYVTGDASTQQQMTPTTNRQTGTEIDRQAAADEQESGDWLEVEKRVSSAGYVDIAAVSTTEMELKRRVDKLSSMITELVAVNRSWDEHCKQLEMSHSQQVAALNAELSDVRQRLDDRQKSDDERQKEFDELLLSAKKQREDAEMANEDALTRLHVEKRLRANAEDRCVEFSRKMAELEAQLRTLQTAQQLHQTNAAQLTQSGQQSPSMSSMTSSPASDRDKMLELQMLREQVTVFQEDFEQERRDREASRATMEHLDTKFRETNLELTTTKKKLMDTLASLRTSKTENLKLKDRFQKVADDLLTLQRHAATRPVPPAPTGPYVYPEPPLYGLQPQHIYGAGARHVWSCATCTYENPAQRTSCEMCGRLKTAGQDLLGRGADVHHHVAGLHEFSAVPSTHSDWPRLPSSNLETDQSPHQQL